jgi:tripartite-type tricarboxylate transporter receptor subunit TctC
MPLSRRRTLATMAALLAAPALGRAQSADPYPSRAVRIIVPYGAGANPDVLARLLGQRLAGLLGQAFVIENRPGAGGSIGAEAVAKSAPDGYTLGLLSSGEMSINPALYSRLSYQPQRDFVPIAALVSAPTLLVVNASLAPQNIKEFIAYAKARPGELHYGTPGNGSIHHLTTATFSTTAGLELVHVPFKAIDQAVLALLGGSLQFMFSGISTVMPHIRTGKLRVLAVSSSDRLPMLPNVPHQCANTCGVRTRGVQSRIVQRSLRTSRNAGADHCTTP